MWGTHSEGMINLVGQQITFITLFNQAIREGFLFGGRHGEHLIYVFFVLLRIWIKFKDKSLIIIIKPIMHISLKNLDFGAPAAERDINQGLIDYFFESGSFKNLLNGRKSVLLGNRGTGKSAIFKILAEEYRKSNLIWG